MLYFTSICIALFSSVWAQQCPNLESCIQSSAALCGDAATQPRDRNGAGRDSERDGKQQMMTCIKAKLTASGFDFEQFKSGGQNDANRCHPGKIFEACGIEFPGSGRQGGPRGGGKRGPVGQGPSDGAAEDRQGPRGKFGARNNDEAGQEGKDGRGQRRGQKGGDHEKLGFLKGCRSEFGYDQTVPVEGPRCHMRALHQCLKDNRAEIETAAQCSLPEEEERNCDPQVALAIHACRAEN